MFEPCLLSEDWLRRGVFDDTGMQNEAEQQRLLLSIKMSDHDYILPNRLLYPEWK